MSSEESIPGRGIDLDAAFSEFSDPDLAPPSSKSVKRVLRLGRRLVTDRNPSLRLEAALFNGEDGFAPARQEGDILYIERHLDADAIFASVKWYRAGSFQNLCDAYDVVANDRAYRYNFALNAGSVSDLGNPGSNQEDETATAEETAHTLLEELQDISGRGFNDLKAAIDTIIFNHGTKSMFYSNYLHVYGNDLVQVKVRKREAALKALRQAPQLELMLVQAMYLGSQRYTQYDKFRVLENGSAEYEPNSDIGEVIIGESTDLTDEVERRRSARENALQEGLMGLQRASQGNVDYIDKNLRTMLHFAGWNKF